MNSKLLDLVETFDATVGDNPLQDTTITINIFHQLLREVRNRKQRSIILQHQEVQKTQTLATTTQARSITPPPKYSNAKHKKVTQFTAN